MSRIYPQTPIPAVSGICFSGRGEVLLIRRNNPPARGLWSFPGGVVRLGETLAEALIREFREETGLIVRPGPLVSALDRIVYDDAGQIRYHYILLDYLCKRIEGNLAAGSDAGEAKWIGIDDIEGMRVTEGLKRIIDRAKQYAPGKKDFLGALS